MTNYPSSSKVLIIAKGKNRQEKNMAKLRKSRPKIFSLKKSRKTKRTSLKSERQENGTKCAKRSHTTTEYSSGLYKSLTMHYSW